MTYKLIYYRWDDTGMPFAVTWPGQVFTYDLRWRPWGRRDRQEWQSFHAGKDSRVRKASRQEAVAAIEQITEDVRSLDLARWINRAYRYYAWRGQSLRASLVDKNAVAYERFVGRSWIPTDRPDGELTEVEPEDADEFKAARGVLEPEPPRPVAPGAEAERGVKSEGYVVTENGSGRLVTMIITNGWHVAGRELVRTYAGRDAWMPSDLLAQIAAGRYDWTVRKADQARYDSASSAMTGVIKRVEAAGWIHHDTRYYFVVDSQAYRTPVYELVRVRRGWSGRRDAESFTGGRWEKSMTLEDMSRGKGPHDYRETVEVSAADARRYQAGHYRRGR